MVAVIRDYLPRGNTLDDEAFRQRHALLCWVLALHIPSLFAFGMWRGYGAEHSALEMAVPVACLVFGRLAHNRRLAAFFVTAGLVFCSTVLVHLSDGNIEAHFHFFILIGLIALYQDWVPFMWNAVFTFLSHGVGTVVAADLIYNHAPAQNRPWIWAGVHGVAVLAACVGVIIFWKNTEKEQQRGANLAAELSAAELAAVQADAAHRQSVSELFVNLARRNQTLLDRQMTLIADLEQRERVPEALSDLFKLDHLATRIRRNAESLLVLSGDDPPRRWGRPVPLSEVVRAGAAEVEDFGRVEVHVNEHLEVAGQAVADLAHLLAELIENATNFSPPNSEVRVRSHLVPGDGTTFVLSIEDTGIGMPAADMRAANELLATTPEVDLRRSRLGFHVVSRLAKRYGLDVRLANTPGGGVTALVTLPEALVSERRQPTPVVTGMEPSATRVEAAPDPPVWMVPDADTLARMVVPASAQTSRRRPPPVNGTAGRAWPVVEAPADGGTGGLAPLPARVRDWQDRPPDPAPDGSAPPAPLPARRARRARREPGQDAAPAPDDRRAPDDPTGPGDGRTPDGLARRVPGAGLAPALRRSSDEAPQAATTSWVPATDRADRDNERVRSMLSRFQASQRAGRVAAEAETDSPSPEEDP